MMTKRISMFAMTAALAALSATAATTTLRLDTRAGIRPARASEPLAYSTAWNGTSACSIALDGAPLLSNATGTGAYAWNAAAAVPGFHTLTFDDGVETSRAVFRVGGGGAIIAWGEARYGQCNVPDGTNFVQVAAGADFVVGLKADGTVELWGDGANSFYYDWISSYDEFGNWIGDEPDESFNQGFVQVDAGSEVWIGLRADGSIHSHQRWHYGVEESQRASAPVMVAVGGYVDYHDDSTGSDSSGQVLFCLEGDGSVKGWFQGQGGGVFSVPGRMNGAIAISAGDEHLLSLKADGSVSSWYFGYNDDWSGKSKVPPELPKIKAIAAGGMFSMALSEDGNVVVWGDRYNEYGVRNIPAEATNVVEIAAGSYFCMARTADGRVVCWGGYPWEDYGESNVPAFSAHVLSVGAGSYTGLAVVEAGLPELTKEPEGVSCHVGQPVFLDTRVVSAPPATLAWLKDGEPLDGACSERLEIGVSTAEDSGDYRLVASNAVGVVMSDVVRVTVDPAPAVDRIHKLTGAPFVGNRLVLRAKPYGDLSNATYAWKRDGVTVATTERLDIASLTAADFGTYTLTVTTPYGTATSVPYMLEPAPAGVPVGWGASGHGRTSAPEGLTGLAQVASGMNFNLGLSTNGTVTAWGYNGHGACDVPEGLAGVSSVAAGGCESQGAGFAVRTDGSVVAWGQPMETHTFWDDWAHYDYETGTYTGDWHTSTNGWDTVSTMPADLSDVVKVALGGECAIALRADGTVTAWGRTVIGESWEDQWSEEGEHLGTVRVVTTNDIYAAPADLSDVVDIAAGSAFLMALRADGTVVVWNDGDTYYGDAAVPDGLLDVVAIVAGKENWSGRACFALRADGTIVKWGDRFNDFGLGRETAAGAAAIDAGQEHIMALDSEGNIRVWADWDRYGVKHVPATATNAFAIAAGGYHCTAIVPDSDGDSISDAEEIAYGRDPLVWEDWHRSTVSGTVATEFGPVEGARLWLVDASGTIRGSARTDESGEFRITPVSNSAKSTSGKLKPTPTGLRGTIVDGNILPATYMLKIEAPGAVDAWFDGVPAGSGETPTPIVVPGSMSIVLDVRLDPGQGPADVGIVCLKPENGETNTMVEVSLPDGAVAYLDLWPTEMDADGTIDLGEVGSPASGAASHTVTLKLPGAGAAVPSPVGVYGREGESVPVRVVTDGPRGSLAIKTAPAGATVYVDYADAPLGVTPLSVDNLLAGSHTILLHKDGYLRPRPVVAWVGGDEPTEVAVPLHTAAETNEMTVAVSCVLPDQEIYLDYRPTGEVAPATVGGMDPASHAGDLWHSASHTILLKHPMVRPWAPRFVPEPVYDSDTDAWSYDDALEFDGPQLYDDSDGDGVRNDVAMGEGRNPFYTLGQALDAPQLAWTTGGDRVWRAEKTDAVPTGGFGRSGSIGHGATTWVETKVKGAGTLSFKWMTSCQRRLDMIRLSVDGEDKERLFGETDWTEVSVAVPGVTNHVLRWTFTRGTSGSAGENGAWLDEVVWTPDEAANARTLTVASRYPVCEPAVGDHAFAWGDAVAATASSPYSNGLERAFCTGWTGTGSVPATGSATSVTFPIEQNSALTWSWNTEFMLDLAVEGEGSLSRESGWFAEGATVVVAATPCLFQRFVRWEGDTEGCLITGTTLCAPMTRGRAVRAVFEQDTRTLSVEGCLGAAWPTNGVHTFDMGAALSAWSTNVVEEGRTRYSCTGWNGTGSVPAAGSGTNAVFALLEDSAIAWTWRTNYLVSVTVVGDGNVDFAEGWVEAGSNLVVTATPGDTAYTAAVWSGDIEGAVTDGLRITVPVDGPKDIAISFEALGIGRAIEQESREWTTGTDGPAWLPVTEGTHDGVDACRSGSISGDYGESVLSATFSGPGDLSFWWRLGASASTCGIDLYVDGRDVNVWLVDATDWTRETVALGDGDHVVEWIFWGDGLDPQAAAWLDQVSFGDGSVTETQETPVPVPHSWLAGHGLGDETAAGYETAAKAWAANGVNRVWECYAVGLDPTDATARFRATIRFENGRPVIETDPPRPEQTPAGWYKVEGKPRLEDPWGERTEDSRFFHVRVDIPEE